VSGGEQSSTSKGDGDFQPTADGGDRPPPSTNKKNCACQQMQAKEWDPSSPKLDTTTTAAEGGDGRPLPRVDRQATDNDTTIFLTHDDAAVFFQPMMLPNAGKGWCPCTTKIGLGRVLGGKACISKGGEIERAL